MRTSAPANLLLLGEYAVLERGGLGLAVALDIRVRVEARPCPAAGLTVRGRWGGGEDLRWRPGSAPDPRTRLVQAVAEAARRRRGDGRHPEAEVEVDSSAFFAAGRKLGFGSSAAAAVALGWALLAAGLPDGAPDPDPELALDSALEAHRLAQGRRGSGYDVYASFHGGVGLFTGGERPEWRPLHLPWLSALRLRRGAHSVPTPEAIGRYRRWKELQPEQARRFLEESNRSLRGFIGCSSPAESFRFFTRSRELGLRLGEAIGVPAEVPSPPGVPPERCKAVGAGDELLWLFPGAEAPQTAGFETLAISREGVLWER